MRNYTPHKLTIYPADTPDQIDPAEHTPLVVIPPQPITARLEEPIDAPPYPAIEYRITPEHTRPEMNYPIVVQKHHPEEVRAPERFYNGVVSKLYAMHAHMADPSIPMFFPDKLVRNMEGTVIGCRQLGKYTRI